MSTEVDNLVRRLLTRREEFFDKSNVLNSDGRRLLNKVIRMVLSEYPELRKLASKTRKNPTLENVTRLAEEITRVRELKKSHT
ncbi:MAG: hypothetical protein LM561_02265 [Desulfurococcaceae archaeon]|jgi:hypothetical protein|nr:hypothetical protein [Desulfurococcaceae archaeon]